MTIPASEKQRPFAISVPPLASNEVEYYHTIALTIILTNISGSQVLIEDVTLRFQSDSAQAALNTKAECGWELDPGVLHEVKVDITPTPLYKEFTNVFDIRVKYRVMDGDRVGDQQFEVYPSRSYIIIREPKNHIGHVFISLKQPEDLDLGRLMARMVRRAGLVPFLKDDNQRLSEDIWIATIEPALRSSQACIVIWTDHTNWIAEGVKREISFCREGGVPEALFLEQGSAVPQLYAGTNNEYTYFDPKNPGKAFADGAAGLRHRLQGCE